MEFRSKSKISKSVFLPPAPGGIDYFSISEESEHCLASLLITETALIVALTAMGTSLCAHYPSA